MEQYQLQSQQQIKLPTFLILRGFSSVGRAPALQAGCQRFESANLHLKHYSRLASRSNMTERLFAGIW